MDHEVIVLSGMPASGKSTIAESLCAADGSRFAHLKTHRSFEGDECPKPGYLNIPAEQFEQKIERGEFFHFHRRYGRYYGIGRKELLEIFAQGKTPVVQVGRIENFYSFRDSISKFFSERDESVHFEHILLWEHRSELEKRINGRESDPNERRRKLAAIEQEFRDSKTLLDRKENPYTVIIRNANREETCRMITDALSGKDALASSGHQEFMKYILSTNNLNLEGEKNVVTTFNITCSKRLDNYHVRGRRFERDLVVDGILNGGPGKEHLVFEDCEFQNVKLTEIGCRSIRFVRCSIHGDLRVFKGKFREVHIRSCPMVSRFYLEESGTVGQVLQFMESHVGTLKIIDVRLNKLEFSDVNSNCGEIEFLRGAQVENINIRCPVEKLSIRQLPRISLSMEGHVDSIKLEEVNRRILLDYEKEAYSLRGCGRLEDALNRYRTVVLAVYKSFENQKLFSESDVCLFEIRRLGILVKRAASTLPGKVFYSFVQIVAERCFGWGIRLLNNVLTALCVILGFSGVYYCLGRNESLGGPFRLWKCMEISMNRFFLVGADEFDRSFFPFFDSAESIVGVLLLTLITGVLVRKVIR